MLAYFHNKKFFMMFQDQRNYPNWLETTAKALGHKVEDVEVFICPPIRTSQTHLFEENELDQMCLILGNKALVEIDGEEKEVLQWEDPIPLIRFYPEELE